MSHSPGEHAPRSRTLSTPVLLHGGDYNPEQWLGEPGVLDEDFALMREAGWNCLTLAVFSWSMLEPEPSVFSMDWLDDVLHRAQRSGMYVLLATPSGAMPAWLAQTWPEALRMERPGVRMPWSWRHHFCPGSPAFRERVAIVDAELSRRFGRHPAVLLWHVGNEPDGQCFCPLCMQRFRGWLQERYGSLDVLNECWCNAVWSHRTTDWSQITPLDTSNDAQQLDWLRFCTWNLADLIRHEVAILRQHSDRPATTNFMGLRPGVDYARLARELDLISDDQYPLYHGDERMLAEAVRISLTQDVMRGLGDRRPWLLMESTPSVTNKSRPPKLKRPGVHRLQMAQALAHGSCGTLCFQWRQARGQREKFHGAVVSHGSSGKSRVFADVARWGHDFGKLNRLLLPHERPADPSAPPAQVALLWDWENWWAMNTSCGPDLPDAPARAPKHYLDTVLAWYRPLWERGVGVDVVGPDADWSGSRVLIAPMRFLIEPDLVLRLGRFVEQGGRLLVTYLSGMVDRHNRCHRGAWPGAGLADLLGVHIELLDGVRPVDGQCVVMAPSQQRFAVDGYATLFAAVDAHVEAVYGADFYAGEPAITRRQVGRGEAWFIGARTAPAGIEHIVHRLLCDAGVHVPVRSAPQPGVTVQQRLAGADRFIFALNFTAQPVRVEIEVQRGAAAVPLELPPFGFDVLRISPDDPAELIRLFGDAASGAHGDRA